MGEPLTDHVPAHEHTHAKKVPTTLEERFWSIARAREHDGIGPDELDPVAVVEHVLAILDALDRGETAPAVSVHTLSFLKLLRESEQRGDLSYAAPEQICGEMLDERSLVFSVGVLLFERLTGRHPFGAEGNKRRQIARIRKGEFGSGVNYFPTVPPGLRTILMKAMGPFPEERWSTLAEMRSRLDQFVAREAPQIHLPGTTAIRKRPAELRPSTDHATTRVTDMEPSVRAELLAAAERAGRASRQTSGEILLAAAGPTVDSAGPDERSAYVSNLHPRKPAIWKSLAWACAGAGIATAAFVLLGSGDRSRAQPATTEVASASPDVTDQPVAAAAQTPPPAVPSQPPAEAVTFDPERYGNESLAIARGCFTGSQLTRGVAFGMGLLYNGDDGRVKRVYFAGTEEIPWRARKCLRNQLSNLDVDAAPGTDRMVDYYVRLRGDTGSAKMRVKTKVKAR